MEGLAKRLMKSYVRKDAQPGSPGAASMETARKTIDDKLALLDTNYNKLKRTTDLTQFVASKIDDQLTLNKPATSRNQK